MGAMDFPPPTLHVFMGSYAPINQGFGSLYQTQPTSFFQDYRNETLSKFMMPTYHWGFTRTPYSPRADLVGAYQKANWKKLLESTSVKLRLIDDGRVQEVDDFYKPTIHVGPTANKYYQITRGEEELCQMHRDQYRDHTGRLHPLKYFQECDHKWNAPNITKTYLDFPPKFVEYRKPLVMPKTYARTVPLPTLPERSLAGRYSPGSDNLYNR